MSTRCTIRFSDDHEEFFVYRHCDGFPDIVIPDIETAMEKAKGRWSGSECGCLVTLFLADNFDSSKKRLPAYHMSSGFHGDESYRYSVDWDDIFKRWDVEEI